MDISIPFYIVVRIGLIIGVIIVVLGVSLWYFKKRRERELNNRLQEDLKKI